MKDAAASCSSGMISGSGFPAVLSVDTRSDRSKYRIFSKKSKSSTSRKQSKQSMACEDERDDWSGQVMSMDVASDERYDDNDDVLASLPASIAISSVHPVKASVSSQRSKASATCSSRSGASIPRDLFIKSKKSSSSIKSSSSTSLSTNRDDLEYWTALSVRAAMAVLQAGGSDKIAQKVSNIVLETGRKKESKQHDTKTLMALSTKLSLAVLGAGGNEKVASAASLIVMKSDKDKDESSNKINGSDSLSGSFHIHEKHHSQAKENTKTEASSVTSSMVAKRRQLEAKEVEMEAKMRALRNAERQNMRVEKEIEKKIAALRGKEEREVTAQQQILRALEKQLDEKRRELKRREEHKKKKQKEIEYVTTKERQNSDAELIAVAEQRQMQLQKKELEMHSLVEVNNRLAAIRMSEEVRLRKEKEFEEKAKTFAKRELEIYERLAAIDAASVSRRKKEKEVEEKAADCTKREQEINERIAALDAASILRRKKEKEVEEKAADFAQREREMNDRLAKIDAASVARRKKENAVERKLVEFAKREQEIDERLAAIDAASVIARQKREVKGKEIEMEEKLKLMELHEKELLVEEKNQFLEEAIRLNEQRETRIRQIMASLDAATNTLLEKAHQEQVETNEQVFSREENLIKENPMSGFEGFTDRLCDIFNIQCSKSLNSGSFQELTVGSISGSSTTATNPPSPINKLPETHHSTDSNAQEHPVPVHHSEYTPHYQPTINSSNKAKMGAAVAKLASNRENRTDRGSDRMNQDSPRGPVQSDNTEEVIKQTVIDTIGGRAKNISDVCGEFLFKNQAVMKAIFPSHHEDPNMPCAADSAAETNMIKSETLNVETKLEENETLAKEAKSKSRLFGRFSRRKKN